MATLANPALGQFVSALRGALVFGQVQILRAGDTFKLRHAFDQAADEDSLREVKLEDLRALVNSTAQGAFRPLKSAPNLATGWKLTIASQRDLGTALDIFYPGAIADWFAVRSGNPQLTNYREFTNRQTGMYRITQMLSDAQAAQVIRACCHSQFCLKQRLWNVEGLAPDELADKSPIPCLEPCALMLEFARTAMRLEQEAASGEGESPISPATAQAALAQTDKPVREADFSDACNPRRLQLVIEKFRN